MPHMAFAGCALLALAALLHAQRGGTGNRRPTSTELPSYA
jgi:hypothetical protein